MKTLVCTEPHQFDYTDTVKPSLEKGTAIIKIKRIGICGTDLHAYEGTQPFFNYPRILGHELAGIIEEIDEDAANGFAIGQAVSIVPYFNCGKCVACRAGKSNCCSNINVFGVHVDGGMREYIKVPVQFLLKANLSFDELVLIEPLAIGAHALNRALLKQNEFVLVIGAGPIGLGIAALAKTITTNVVVADTNNNRLHFCKTQLGIEYVFNPAAINMQQALADITNNDMAEVVVDATGNRKAINGALPYLAHGGRYVLVGIQKDTIEFQHPEFHKRETTLMSSRNALKEDFDWVISLLESKQIKAETFITHRIAFEDLAAAFPSLTKPENAVIKASVYL
jgi:2-desacetyl-2-hydroxyethyl bacteriochlorophyllide A dehydrogenase